ncbi:MFS transporter prlG [Hyphodiscus hymeniophilus]|uniref:MFS transporter prlG n=1 Tax=Hyphodiscus hymeniophilus TaxID=353542 RepID=A0A9P7B0F9_9HELO|nr:MFS transporter prlG [Hyphodiscus hymeniophilus]
MPNETQPLLGHTIESEAVVTEEPLVDFDPNGDPDNPLDWPKAYKLGVVLLLAFMAFTVTFTCIGVVPVADRIVLDLSGKESKSASILLVTVWELGEAAGPLLIAPLSEIYGRYPIFIVANTVFILGTVLAAISPTTNVFIFARFLTGFAVASNVLSPAIIGDIYASESRGSGMSLIMLAPLLGGAIGPAISGAIAETLGWRKILWICAAVAVTCQIFFLTLLRETYKVPILQRRAARLRKETRDDSLKCAWEEKADETRSWSALQTAIQRPALVMADSGVLQILSFSGGFVFSLYYITATTFPGMLREVYGFSPAMIGASFLSFSIGASVAIVVCNLFLDKTYIALGRSREGPSRPEDRLPFLIGGIAILPFIITLYGWAPYLHWPVGVLLLAMGLMGFALILTWVPLSSYVVDAFGLYSASALTGLLIARCLGGTLLPLAIPPLTDALGLGYGFLVTAAVCLVLIPLPIVIMRYGFSWRQRSVYTKDK